MREEKVVHCLCPSCGVSQSMRESEPCWDCGAPLILHGRYRLQQILGQNVGITYLSFDLVEQQQVVIKELAFHRLDAWKTEDLFLREAEVLEKLQHPRIPAYLDHFSEGKGKQQSHYIVETFLLGKNLQELMEYESYQEESVLSMMSSVLEILSYLHKQRPPVIHRDLKPSNLMRGDDGRFFLIDFGSVKDLSQAESRGETVAGTFGYMAPEQFNGKATALSDLYALGVVALVMMSRRSPDSFMDVGTSLSWKNKVEMSGEMQDLLSFFLANNPTDRVQSTNDALVLVTKMQRKLTGGAFGDEDDGTHHYDEQANTPALAEVESKYHTQVVSSEPDFLHAEYGSWSVGDPPKDGRPTLYSTMGFVSICLSLLVWAHYCVDGPKPKEPTYAPSQFTYQARPTPTSQPKRKSLKHCLPPKCQPLPMGLMGLQFGMTLKEVKQKLPGATFEKKIGLPDVTSRGGALNAAVGAIVRIEIPGHRVYASTLLLGQPSSCQMDFGIQYTLSHIECGLKKATKLSYGKAKQRLLKQLFLKYGKAHSTWWGMDHRYQDVFVDTWTWKGKQSKLVFSSAKTNRYMSASHISNVSRIRLGVTWNRWLEFRKLASHEAIRRASMRITGSKWVMPPLWYLPVLGKLQLPHTQWW